MKRTDDEFNDINEFEDDIKDFDEWDDSSDDELVPNIEEPLSDSGSISEDDNADDFGLSDEFSELTVADTPDPGLDEKTDISSDSDFSEDLSIPKNDTNISKNISSEEKYALDMASDIPVNLVAVVGKTMINVSDMIQYKQGDIIDLKREPNEIVDIVANGRLLAKGELVEIDGRMGVRLIKMLNK